MREEPSTSTLKVIVKHISARSFKLGIALMAKRRNNYRPWQKEEPYKYKSRYGSHKDMLKEEFQESFESLGRHDKVICIDECGEYETEARRIDSGLADPNRYSSNRVRLS